MQLFPPRDHPFLFVSDEPFDVLQHDVNEQLYVDLDGIGFKLMKTFERLPMLPVVCLTAQTIVGKYQREMARKLLMEERRQREMEWAKEDQDADGDDGIYRGKLAKADIDAKRKN